MIAVLVILIFVILIWLSEIQRRKLSQIVKHLPGPRELPVLGSDFVLKNDDITDFQNLDDRQCTAPVMKIFLGPKLVLLVSDPGVLQQLLNSCQEKPYLINFFNLEYGLFSAKCKW